MSAVENIRSALEKWRKAKTMQESREAESEYSDATDQDVMAEVLAHIDSQQSEIERLKAAINRTHTAKGRYHTQLAMCDLYDVVGLPNTRQMKEQP